MKQLTKIALFCLYSRTDEDLHFARCLAEQGFLFTGTKETEEWLTSNGIPLLPANIFPHPIASGIEKLHLSSEILEILEKKDAPLIRAECRLYDIPFIDLVYIDLFPIEQYMHASNSTKESVGRRMDTDGIICMRNALEGDKIVVPKRDPAFFRNVISYVSQRDTISPEKESAFKKEMEEKTKETIREYCELCNKFHKINQVAESIANR